ncbi:hypothetical protein [Streptomyces peucetius]|uniref:Uncharacterized protein n=1 Tax=Streptomyces peucetius TaxID=1950 RepID=A0ABY6I125_STRPE|nr:hypothetical protein [Streptomyces peucetius]UYQ60659.1 hypothetical protein OGH68_03705 [Streptomyces peucetius]
MQEAQSRHAWWWFLAAGAVVIIVYLIVAAPVRHLLSLVLAACATVAVLVGIRWHRPRPSRSWYLFAAGMVLFTAADAIFGAFQAAGTLVPVPSVAYLLLGAGALHPSMTSTTRLVPRSQERLSPARMTVLVLPALLLPRSLGVPQAMRRAPPRPCPP